uniref:Uncharacterized protein n=1 Tax=Rhizophora mucronata TaxID=61149 RepID=A0A2P2NHE1_RHIMU
MNMLIWYSWLGGIVIGTIIGANVVLDEHCRAGPRNAVITGRQSLHMQAFGNSVTSLHHQTKGNYVCCLILINCKYII